MSNQLFLLPGVIKALSKYCVKNFPLAVSDALMLSASGQPELVYAISCRYAALSDVTKAAAKHTLKNPQRLDNLPDDVIGEISSLQYHALGKYQIACRAAAGDACAIRKMMDWCEPSDVPGARSTEHGSSNEFHAKCDCIPHWEYIKMQQTYGPPGDPIDVEMHECRLTDWLEQYMSSVREAVLKGEEVSGKVALRPKLVAAAVAASKGCPSCGADVTELLTFAQSLGNWIDRAIDRVGAYTSI